MSITKKLAAGSTLRVVNFAATVVVLFFLTPFVIRSLGDRAYGFWVLVGTFIGYYGLFDLGLATAVSRFIAGALGRGDRADATRIFSTARQLYWGLGLIVFLASCLLAAASPLLVRNAEDAALFSKVILILGVNMTLLFVLKNYLGLLTAQVRFDIMALLELMTLFLRTTMIVVALKAGGGVLALAWVTFLSGLPRLLLSVYLSRRMLPWLRYQRQPVWSPTTKSLFGYSMYQLVIRITNEVRTGLDSIVITAFVGLSAVTHFSIAGVLMRYFGDFVIAITGPVQPVFSQLEGKNDWAGIHRMYYFSMKISMGVATFVGFGFVAWGQPFIQRWMGPDYLDAYPCLLVLAVAWTFNCWHTPSYGLLFGLSKNRFYAYVNTIEAAANLALSLLLVKPLGIFGVALGTAIPMTIVRFFVMPYYVCRVVDLPVATHFQAYLRNILVILAALPVPAAITYVFAGPSYVQLMTVGALSAASYAVVVWLLLFTPAERSRLLDLVRARRVAPVAAAPELASPRVEP